MPVSKKRKKEGKPVQRKEPAAGEEQHDHPDAPATHEKQRLGKPKNPFVAQQPQHRGQQRGR
jgi:hypothetical protein